MRFCSCRERVCPGCLYVYIPEGRLYLPPPPSATLNSHMRMRRLFFCNIRDVGCASCIINDKWDAKRKCPVKCHSHKSVVVVRLGMNFPSYTNIHLKPYTWGRYFSVK